jgi:hypothetical protein
VGYVGDSIADFFASDRTQPPTQRMLRGVTDAAAAR